MRCRPGLRAGERPWRRRRQIEGRARTIRTLLDAQAGDGADARLPRGELKASHGREGKARAENGAPKGGIAGLGRTIAFYENESGSGKRQQTVSFVRWFRRILRIRNGTIL